MKKTGIKALCYTLAAASVVSIVSIINSDLTALAMEPYNPQEETQEEFIEYMHENSDKIEIKVIGDMEIDNTYELNYILKNDEAQEEAMLSQQFEYAQNANNISVETSNLGSEESNGKLVFESIKIDGIEKTDNISDIKQKKNKEETKAYIISNEKIESFLSDDNMDTVNELLDNGYSLYFETNSNYEIDLINHKFGLLEFLPREEDYEVQTENSLKVQEDIDNNEDVDVGNGYILGSFISRNMAGEYFYGTLQSSIDDNVYNSMLTHAVLRRKNYTSYKDPANLSKVKQSAQPAIINADAAEVYDGINLRNWHIMSYGRESWFQAYGNRWLSSDKVLFANVTTFDTYGYSIDTSNRALYLNIIRMSVVPYNDATTKSVYWENISNQSNINLYDFGPQYQPQTATITLGFSSDLSVKAGFDGSPSAEVGGSIGFSCSYAFPYNEITVSNPHADYQTKVATADFAYKDDDEFLACRQLSTNMAYSVFRATTSGAITFSPAQKVVLQVNAPFFYSADEHYQYYLTRSISPNNRCF